MSKALGMKLLSHDLDLKEEPLDDTLTTGRTATETMPSSKTARFENEVIERAVDVIGDT